MSEIDLKAIYKKHAPSASQFFFRGGLILLVFWLAGLAYGQFFMEVPPGLTSEEESQFRLGIGFGIGLQYALIPILLLCLHFGFRLFQANKSAKKEISDFYLNKVRGGK
ncbi:hypothetical protein KFJ24_02565 [Marinobacter sediminum]|uniref:hypothetical protein n=1 Tax=Marinobacter sediminum TaxID=256323 RepID=UPI00202F74BE|nr:hypothetical protein [Marinobacter sediminum]MCM0611357.1 hypothetical protein [Marinobacter sediminum]